MKEHDKEDCDICESSQDCTCDSCNPPSKQSSPLSVELLLKKLDKNS